jgi:hydroxymethylbilane synthase
MSASDVTTVRIATRASTLALWQANHVAGLIQAASPQTTVEIIHITTSGDRDQTGALRSFGGLGVFTREVQRAVLDGRADLAVHSLKDLPTEPTPALSLAAVPAREETADALVLPAGTSPGGNLAGLKPQARVGTGSLRRRAQLLFARADLVLEEIRGNVETRLRKLDEGQFDALVLAAAGLKRLGLAARITERLTPPVMYAAVGQGALGLECRTVDHPLRELLATLDDSAAHAGVTAERALLAALRAGCHAPVGARTTVNGDRLTLEGVVLSSDGRDRLVAEDSGEISDGENLGRRVADSLVSLGARTFLEPD